MIVSKYQHDIVDMVFWKGQSVGDKNDNNCITEMVQIVNL